MSRVTTPPLVHDEAQHVAHPARALTLIALAIAAILAGGYGLRAVENNRPRLPDSGMHQGVGNPAP